MIFKGRVFQAYEHEVVIVVVNRQVMPACGDCTDELGHSIECGSERGGGIFDGRTTAVWSKHLKWRKGLFEGCGEDMEEDQLQADQNWRPNAPGKWDTIASGQWIQKAAWNRMVTTMERDQPHKTPVTSTWTADFLTREGERRKAVGDGLRDKRSHGRLGEGFSKRMRASSRARLVCKNGASIQMGFANCASAAGRWALSF